MMNCTITFSQMRAACVIPNMAARNHLSENVKRRKSKEPRSIPLRVSVEALFCCLQKVIQEIHALYFLLKVCASIDIQSK